jgi:hypothetical protein
MENKSMCAFKIMENKSTTNHILFVNDCEHFMGLEKNVENLVLNTRLERWLHWSRQRLYRNVLLAPRAHTVADDKPPLLLHALRWLELPIWAGDGLERRLSTR